MDCDHAILRVYEYLDGELTVWKRRVIVSKCREEVPSELRAKIASALGIDAPPT